MTTTVVKAIRIDHPGDGEWLMDRIGGSFTPETDHSFVNVRGDVPLGGFVTTAVYLGGSITVHMAGVTRDWCSRDLMWMVFDFAFHQLGVRKVIAPVESTNKLALALNLRAGFQLEAVLKNATANGHLMLLTMTKENCRWLNHRSKAWLSNTTVVEAGDGR